MRRSVLRLTAMLAVFPGFATIAPHATAADPTLLFDGEIVAGRKNGAWHRIWAGWATIA